jgi:glycosyltransferase involved in cell wall biosynthesis
MSRKLLIVTTVASTLNAFLLPFADHFRGLGWTVDAAAAGIDGDPRCARHFDRTWELGWSRSPRDPGGLRAAAEIRRLVGEGGYDVVHVHTPIAGFVTRFALRGLRRSRGLKVVYTAHGLHSHPEGGAPANAAFCALERLAGRWTDALVVINREDEAYARTHRLAGRGALYQMPGIGVDLERYSREQTDPGAVAAVRAEIGLAPEDKMLLMVAEFSPGKRHSDAVTAFARMEGDAGAPAIPRSERPGAPLAPAPPAPRVHLVLAGDGVTKEKVRALVSALGLSERVHLLGIRDDVPVLLATAEALVLPSEREGLPRVVLEAMAMGTPVIGSRIRGTTELLEGGCGFLFELGDVDALAAAMRQAIEEPAVAKSMAAAARLRVERYALPRVIEMHQQMYEALLRSSPAELRCADAVPARN